MLLFSENKWVTNIDKLINWKVFESKGKLWRIYTVSLFHIYLIHDTIYTWSTHYVNEIKQFSYNIPQFTSKLSKTMTWITEFHWNKQYLKNVIIGISIAHFTRSDTQLLRAILYFIVLLRNMNSLTRNCNCLTISFQKYRFNEARKQWYTSVYISFTLLVNQNHAKFTLNL